MAGVQGAVFVPGSQKVALPRTSNGIAVFSMGSLIPESEALDFESAAHGESHTWRATREFALLGEILGAFEWGSLDLLMFDLPPGAERTVQYADFLGPRTSFVLVTIPSEVSRGVVARSVAALSKGPNRVLGYVENMSGYYCRDCNGIKPLFDRPQALWPGDPLPRDRPLRSRACAALRSGDPSRGIAQHTRRPRPGPCRAATSVTALNRQRSLAMKFLCVPCDSPMKLQTVGPPERGSLSVVYSCPECGYEMAMLTNAYETQVVQSLGVRIGPQVGRRRRQAASRSGGKCPFTAMIPGNGEAQPSVAAEPASVRWTAAAEAQAREHSRVRPPHGQDRHREVRARQRISRSGREDPRRRQRILRNVIRDEHSAAEHRRIRNSPGRTSFPGTSPTAATSPASTAISTPAARLRSARRTSPIAASSAPRNASGSSTKSPRSRLSASRS